MSMLVDFALVALGSVCAGAALANAVRDDPSRLCPVHDEPHSDAPATIDQDDAAKRAIGEAVVEHASEVIIGLDFQRQPLFVSPACRQVLGCEPADLMQAVGPDRGSALT